MNARPIAIVSGASRGLGKAIALKLLQEQYVVIGLYKSRHDTALLLRSRGIDMQQADISVEADIIKAVEYGKRTYGRVDVVINNAGINIFGNVESYTTRDWNTMIATDLTAVFLLSKYAIPLLKQSGNANIINISSRRGVDTFVEPGFVAYSVAKASVNIFTMGLAKELSSAGIRVNAVIPTPTKTDLFDETFTPGDEALMKANGTLGSPQEVAALVWDIITDTSLNGQLVFDKRIIH